MISIEEFEKFRKDEMIKIYSNLVDDYEDLEQQYNDLDDCYGELERSINNKEDEIDEEDRNYSLELLIQELKFNTDLQNMIQEELFEAYKQDFISILRFYCVDIPEDIHNMRRPTINGINEKICDIFEDYIEEALRFKIWE